MRVYIAASFNRRDEAKGIARAVTNAGHFVTSRWIESHMSDDTIGPLESEREAEDDVEDVFKSQVVLFIANGPTCGKMFEIGYACALDIPVLIVGPRSHIFHHLFDQVDTMSAALAWLKGKQGELNEDFFDGSDARLGRDEA